MGKKTWIATLAAPAAACLLLLAAPAQAQAGVNASVYVQIAPPAPRYEVAPAARRGHVWVPGHWQWRPRRHQHVWVPGNFVTVRPGYRYTQPQWVRDGNRWGYHGGGWVREARRAPHRADRDRDGIPNRFDRDRDGDGVRNGQDRRPDNRHRY